MKIAGMSVSKQRSLPASLAFIGQVTKHTTLALINFQFCVFFVDIAKCGVQFFGPQFT